MRIRSTLLIAGFALTATAASCGRDDLSATAADTRFEVAPGDRFSIVLEANPTTGYGWELSEEPPRAVVRLVADRYEPQDGDGVGGGGLQEMTFEAVEDGSTYLQLWYIRPFDDPPEPADQAQFEVIVGSGVPADADQSADGDRPSPPIPDDESAISVAELLERRPAGEVIVWAAAFDGGRGLLLCGALAESFPPQCPGEAIAVANPEQLATIDFESAGGVRWTDRPVTVLGTLTSSGFEVRLVAQPDGG